MQADLKAALALAAERTQAMLAATVGDVDGPVPEAMVYAAQGGKALRGFLVLEGARVLEVPEANALPAATAVECIHAYSLVHDDMPIMDDDDTRRGRPTVHKAWDDATALLVGDALQSVAFEILVQGDAPPERRLILSATLAQAAGVRGMVGGQAMDIAAETAASPLTLEQITRLQRGKTGALIEWSAMAGPRLARADIRPMQLYGTNLGLAFQIADDILDVTGDANTMGKAVGKDAGRGKATFVSLLGLDGAKRRAAELVQEACDGLSLYGDKADRLRDAARFVIARDT